MTTATEEPPAPPPPAGGDGGAAATGGGRGRSVVGRLAAVGNALVVPVLALVTALVVGGLVMVFTDPDTLDEWGLFFADPAGALEASWDLVFESYRALWRSSVGSSAGIGRTLVEATPLALAGLSVAFAFRAGLFNIGGAGQLVIGATCAGWVGFTWDLPAAIHLPLAVVAGFLGGAAWGAIAGVLKARTGAHEVITTIMLNSVAAIFIGWLIIQSWVRDPVRSDPISQRVEETARMPRLLAWLDPTLRVHLGIVLAVLATIGVAWLLHRSRFGFELRAVGLNPDAARTAGMSVTTVYVQLMVICGALAGLGGATVLLGTAYALTTLMLGSVGFDGILVGLLGRAKPWGVFAAALLFGALQAGGRAMQTGAMVSLELVQVLQALIVIFVAAPALVKATFRLRPARLGRVEGVAARGW